jgi:hypothetical protein
MQNRQTLQTRFGRITIDGEGDMMQRFVDASTGAVALTRLVEQEVTITKLADALRGLVDAVKNGEAVSGAEALGYAESTLELL